MTTGPESGGDFSLPLIAWNPSTGVELVRYPSTPPGQRYRELAARHTDAAGSALLGTSGVIGINGT